jgi:branched-subunit amino acid aminotransferase/4-amino-4-deoxychorismate lyase
MHMAENQLYAITDEGLQRLNIPAGVTNLNELYAVLDLGVYSALRTFEHNKFLALEEHIARTIRSMRVLGWEYGLDEPRLRRALDEAVTAYPAADARVRFDVLAGPGTAVGTNSRELIALTPFTPEPARNYVEGVGAHFVSGMIRGRPKAKTAEFAARRNRMLPSRDQAHYEYLLLDEDEHILEGSLTNFWAVRDGVVYTAGAGVLEGVTRKILLELIPKLDLPLHLKAITKSEIPTLDEAFLSGSSRAVVPVVTIAGKKVGNGRPGPIARQILRAYQGYVSDHVRRATDPLNSVVDE